MELYYATTNSGKVTLLQRDFEKYGIKLVQAALKIPEPRSRDVKAIAKAKVLYAFDQLRKGVVVLDAGFHVFSLRGFPGAYVNFVLETIGLEGVLKLVEDKDRACEFRECLAYLDDSLVEPELFFGSTRGSLAYQPRGVMQEHLWSELSLIFIPEGKTRTLAEMNCDEYLEWRRASKGKLSAPVLFATWFVENRQAAGHPPNRDLI